MNYRSIWISDVHLGTRGCQAEKLLDFLKKNDSENLYLVGDIVDFWGLQRSWYWPPLHNTVVQKILRIGRSGTRIVYVQGNHDPVWNSLSFFFEMDRFGFGTIEVVREAVHVTADGKALLILHGDQFDGLIRCAPVLVRLGDKGYDILLTINRNLHRLAEAAGIRYRWSLSAAVKNSVKSVANYIGNYEILVANHVRRMGLDGVVCGHIHKASAKRIGNIDYYNDGDWVESCTALVEHMDGRLEIVDWKNPPETPVFPEELSLAEACP